MILSNQSAFENITGSQFQIRKHNALSKQLFSAPTMSHLLEVTKQINERKKEKVKSFLSRRHLIIEMCSYIKHRFEVYLFLCEFGKSILLT